MLLIREKLANMKTIPRKLLWNVIAASAVASLAGLTQPASAATPCQCVSIQENGRFSRRLEEPVATYYRAKRDLVAYHKGQASVTIIPLSR